MPKLLTTIALILAGLSTHLIVKELEPQKNSVALSLKGPHQSTTIRIAVVSDLHLTENADDFKILSRLTSEILRERPDLIVVLGDLITSPRKLISPQLHRDMVIQRLNMLPRSTTAFVLGNYESWDDRRAWLSGLTAGGFNVLENETRLFGTDEGMVCVRGLGDRYTNKYAPTPLPPQCTLLPTITITHDPAAAFEPGVDGLIIAGHTHCGQISIPFLGPLWAPTEAPRDAWCGLYQDELRTLWVSSGIGTSVLPIRLGAPSQWDLIEITFGVTGGDQSSFKIR